MPLCSGRSRGRVCYRLFEKIFREGRCSVAGSGMNLGEKVSFRLFSDESFGKCAPQHERRFLEVELSD
jgi:hypothetical protein